MPNASAVSDKSAGNITEDRVAPIGGFDWGGGAKDVQRPDIFRVLSGAFGDLDY